MPKGSRNHLQLFPKRLTLLKGNCLIGSLDSHEKLKALANEILNDWDAVIAFVNNPELPPTNNEAERALRHAVIGRRISYGTRTTEGSLASAFLAECNRNMPFKKDQSLDIYL